MLKKSQAESQLEFYQDHLVNNLLPFWLKNSIDYEYGGFYTCFDNTGKTLISKDKYTWSQGRMVWVLSKLSSMDCFSQPERSTFIKLAESGAEFLMNNCLLKNGNCTFLMSREGNPKPQVPEGEYDTSFYADCFVILGLSRYASVSSDTESLSFAKRLFNSVYNRVESNTFKSEPYPSPPGYRLHGPLMITLNAAQELVYAIKKLGDEEFLQINRIANKYMYEIMDNFVDEDNVLHEMITTYNNFAPDTLPGRYINPGHTLEDMWFVIHQAVEEGNNEIINKSSKIIKKTFEIGWDHEYNGILLFSDRNGGKPWGSIEGMENEKMVRKVLNDWNSKLWWPHSEALYTTLLAYTLTSDAEFLDLYNKVHDYTFNTFPNPDKDVGEWIQIRDRQGNPEQKVVALPVKDPFHIIRNIVFIIDLLQNYIDRS